MDIKENIKRVIKEHGKTSKEVAEIKGVSPITFTRNISNNPTVNTLQDIADIIGCDIAEFFQQEEKEEERKNIIVCPSCGCHLIISPEKQE